MAVYEHLYDELQHVYKPPGSRENLWTAFLSRMAEIGISDLHCHRLEGQKIPDDEARRWRDAYRRVTNGEDWEAVKATMADKHTPGPWKANCFLVTAGNGRDVTHTGLLGRRRSSHPDQDGGDEDAVNARLIAAAPDLLEACRDFVSKLDDYFAGRINIRPDYADRARAAIAKATTDNPSPTEAR